MTLTLRYAACLLLTLVACRKGDQVPAYLVVPAVTVQATMAEGYGTSKITDAWISVDDRSLGIWELPARIPVIGDGPLNITVAPAIKRNGSFDDRIRYPFYRSWNGTANLVKEQAVTVAPVVQYEDAANFWWEGFDEPGNRFSVSADSDTILLLYTPTSNPEIVLDGTSCAGFVLTTDRDRMSIFTTEDFGLSAGPAFLEMDYSTDINLTIGFSYTESGSSNSEPWVVLVPTTSEGGLKWNKVYIDLSSFFNSGGISQRDLYLTAQLPSGQSTAHVYLENFKLVRRDQ